MNEPQEPHPYCECGDLHGWHTTTGVEGKCLRMRCTCSAYRPAAPVAQERPARWVKPAMRPPTDAEVAECTECDSDGCHPEVDMRKPVGGKCWFGCEKPINPPPDPMWCADPAPGNRQEPPAPTDWPIEAVFNVVAATYDTCPSVCAATHPGQEHDATPGSAQEPADPPWLTEAARAQYEAEIASLVMPSHYVLSWDRLSGKARRNRIAWTRAALPILRAGIEAEYHAKLVREIGRMP